MDPEQIYQEVLQEEQGKGSPSAVAEGRAKAARQRAVHGSPHPKEAKWWPGSQPRWEGGDGAAPAEAEPEEAVEEAPEQEAAPEPEPEPAPEPAAAPAAEAPAAPAAEAPAAAAPAAEAPTAAAPAAVSTAPPPTGVTHGTPSGNRLRPEDGVATQAQFDAQQAHYERRKLIDDLVGSGVPAVAAQDAMRPRAPFLALLYILIPIVAVIILVSQEDSAPVAGEGGGEGGGGGGGGDVTVVAENIAFDTSEITVTAGEETAIFFDNADSVEHNISVFETSDASAEIFVGEIINGGETITYDVPAVDAGEYYFHCDVHPNMNGAYVAE